MSSITTKIVVVLMSILSGSNGSKPLNITILCSSTITNTMTDDVNPNTPRPYSLSATPSLVYESPFSLAAGQLCPLIVSHSPPLTRLRYKIQREQVNPKDVCLTYLPLLSHQRHICGTVTTTNYPVNSTVFHFYYVSAIPVDGTKQQTVKTSYR